LIFSLVCSGLGARFFGGFPFLMVLWASMTSSCPNGGIFLLDLAHRLRPDVGGSFSSSGGADPSCLPTVFLSCIESGFLQAPTMCGFSVRAEVPSPPSFSSPSLISSLFRAFPHFFPLGWKEIPAIHLQLFFPLDEQLASGCQVTYP